MFANFVLLCCYQEVVMYRRNSTMQYLVIRVIRNHHYLQVKIILVSYNKESHDTHYIGRTVLTDVRSPSDNIRRFNTTPPNLSKRDREIKGRNPLHRRMSLNNFEAKNLELFGQMQKRKMCVDVLVNWCLQRIKLSLRGKYFFL